MVDTPMEWRIGAGLARRWGSPEPWRQLVL